ncbi:hypothetical protein HU200_039078 [Digitaria exilis]|uniref:Uncharacterized protein n=1 Tax=Digitaria exilis TaxID=1010633 RepID=A0A835BNI4_9POAL|nr:hypothetical protein HU200_039078 [Digitaria exilis]
MQLERVWPKPPFQLY